MAILDKIINEPALIIATSAVVVSVCSIMVATVSLWIQRKHNILSVRPIAGIGRFDYVGYIAIWVKNLGNGPMRVKSIKTTDNQGIRKGYPIDWMPSDIPFARFRKNLENSTIGR
jgi:hypothetical protein